MSLTVADVVRHGRDLSPAFDDRWTPSGPLLRALSRYQQTLMPRIANWKRDAVVSTHEIDMPLVVHEEGESIPDHVLVHGARVVFTNSALDPEAVELVQYRHRLQRHRFRWGAYIQGTTFYPMGKATDWTDVLRIDVDYFPLPGELAAATDPFVLPGDAMDVLAAHAAWFLARRAQGTESPPDLGLFAADLKRAEDDYLDQVTGRRRAVVSQTQEVW